jgi:hypothetical protein
MMVMTVLAWCGAYLLGSIPPTYQYVAHTEERYHN